MSPASISPVACSAVTPHSRLAAQDRAIQRRGAAIARDARMNDDRAMAAPDGFGDGALEKRRDDQIGPNSATASSVTRVVDVELDRDLVAGVRQLDVQPLREAVERVREEEDPHRASG